MQIEFVVNEAASCLEVRTNGKTQLLVTPALLWSDEREEVLGYLHRVADRMNELHSSGHVEQVAALLMQADPRVGRGQCVDYEIAESIH
jgi:hypothetical protein